VILDYKELKISVLSDSGFFILTVKDNLGNIQTEKLIKE